jgi:hypothetical protein
LILFPSLVTNSPSYRVVRAALIQVCSLHTWHQDGTLTSPCVSGVVRPLHAPPPPTPVRESTPIMKTMSGLTVFPRMQVKLASLS